MSLRDKKRGNKQRTQTVDVANLEAIVQHQAEAQQQRPIRIMGETESTPGLDAVNAVDQLPIIPLEIFQDTTTEIKQTEETTMNTNEQVRGQAGDMTIDCSQVLKEGFDIPVAELGVDAQAKNDNNLQLIKDWVTSLDKPEFTPVSNLNIHTLTGETLVTMFGLPKYMPNDVATAILDVVETNEQTKQFTPMVSMVINTALTEEGVDVSKLGDFALNMVKPFIKDKVAPVWETIVKTVSGFICEPVSEEVATPKVETIAERCKRIQAEADAKRAQEAANKSETNTELKIVKTTAVVETGESVATLTMEHPEVVLKRDFAHLVGSPAYFDKRSSLYTKYHAWEQQEQAKRLVK